MRPGRDPGLDGKDRAMADRFPSPFEIQTPAGAEGWQELYTY